LNYGKNRPFDHVIINNFFEEEFANLLSSEFPDFEGDI